MAPHLSIPSSVSVIASPVIAPADAASDADPIVVVDNAVVVTAVPGRDNEMPSPFDAAVAVVVAAVPGRDNEAPSLVDAAVLVARPGPDVAALPDPDNAAPLPTPDEFDVDELLGQSECDLYGHYTNQRLISPSKKMAYIVLLLTDLENVSLLADKKDILTPTLFVKSEHPYSLFIDKKGFKTKIIANKSMISQEILRRSTIKSTNYHNKTVLQLMTILAKTPLTCDNDATFVKQEDARFRMTLQSQLDGEQDDPAEGVNRQTAHDRLRFIVLLCTNETIYSAYLRSHNSDNREDQDYRNSDERELDWRDLMSDAFNDEFVDAETPAVPNLHTKFRLSIECPRSNYQMTREKAKSLISDQRTSLRQMIGNYNKSGNGSDMALFDEDTDCEEEVEENEESYGRFNAGRASRRANRREKQEDLMTVDGDDRSSFLKHRPYDLLMW